MLWNCKILVKTAWGAAGASFVLFFFNFKEIPGAMNGLDITGVVRVWLNVLTQAANMGIDGARGGIDFVAPNIIQQTVSAQKFALMPDEVFQQQKLTVGQVLPFAGFENFMALEVDDDFSERNFVRHGFSAGSSHQVPTA